MTIHDTTPEPTVLAADDPRALFATAVRSAGELIRTVAPDELALPTPCTEMDVRYLMGHMLVVLRRLAALGNGSDPMAMPDAVTGVPDDGWYATWLAEAHEVQLAWTDPATLRREMVLPWATAPGAAMVLMYTSELTVHTWDLGVAVGRVPELDAAVVEASLANALQVIPPGDREALFAVQLAEMGRDPMRPPFRNAVATDADAPAIDRLIGWYGRQRASRR